jgi:hypothetical protein
MSARAVTRSGVIRHDYLKPDGAEVARAPGREHVNAVARLAAS